MLGLVRNRHRSARFEIFVGLKEGKAKLSHRTAVCRCFRQKNWARDRLDVEQKRLAAIVTGLRMAAQRSCGLLENGFGNSNTAARCRRNETYPLSLISALSVNRTSQGLAHPLWRGTVAT
jgi:hypothetical protein